MKPLDLVADAQELYRSEAVPNSYDELKRDRLPKDLESIELEWRVHPLPLETVFRLTNRKVGLWLFVAFLTSTFAIAPVARLYGTGVFSPVTYPLAFLASGIAAYHRFATTASFEETAWRFFLPQALFVFLECSFSPGIDRRWVLVPVIMSVSFLGYLVDQVNTHYIWWITANLRLKREAVVMRRRLWTLRFNPVALTKEIVALRRTARQLETEARIGEALILRRHANELRELRAYPLGFCVLAYVTALLLLGAPSGALVLSAFALSVALAFRKPLISIRTARFLCETLLCSLVSWFAWDPAQGWLESPGMFRDRLPSRYWRLINATTCFTLVHITFVPPITLWGSGEWLTPIWLWGSACGFFLNLFLPVLLFISVLIATGARPLWIHLAAIEWKDRSDELEDL
jgi:hypothetical protein